MENERCCPNCNKQLKYCSKYTCKSAEDANVWCRSCSTKRQYKLDPEKNKGVNNGRTGKATLDVFKKKYGDTEGVQKYEELIVKLGEHGFKHGKQNPSYGKVPTNTGWSYKGWYKGLFFRSSLELLFIMEFESKNNRLPLSAEGSAFRVVYADGTYCPDFFDPITNTVFEIKSERFVKDNTEKFDAAKPQLFSRGFSFEVVTDKQISYRESAIVWQLKRLAESQIIELTELSKIKLYKRLQKIADATKKYKSKEDK